MPYRGRKTYKKRAVRRTKKRIYRKPQKYPNTRAIAIQRMDLVPRQRVMKCVFDDTYLIVPNGTAKGVNTVGLCFNLTNLYDGPAYTVQRPADPPTPFWGATEFPTSQNMSGRPYSDKPYGFSRFIGDGGSTNTAPYRNYMVLGGKWAVRVEQVHKTAENPPPLEELSKVLALVTRMDRNLDSLSPSATLSTWHRHRGIKQSNMTALSGSNSNRPSTSGNQQVRQTGVFSAKKWFDVKDIKDNLNRLGGSFNEDGTYIQPEEDCFLQIGLFDRMPQGDSAGYVLPNFMVRFKYEAIVLCTETNQLNNIDV